MRPRNQRPTDSVFREPGISAPSDRRDRLADDVERYLAKGGRIDRLDGPADRVMTRRIGHGRGMLS